MITEMWRPVIGGEGYYEVSDLGRVRSLPRVIMRKNGMPHTVTGEVLKTHRRSDGRFRADLHLLSGRRQALVHRLVLEAFVGPEPGGMEGCHCDGDPANNRLENLRWDTPSGNTLDSVRHGTHPQARRTRCKRNHLLAGANLTTDDQRRCVACEKARQAVRYGKKKGLALDLEALADQKYAEITHEGD